MAFFITENCKGCGSCKKKCPWDAIEGEKKKRHFIDPARCRECGTCWYTCPKCEVKDPMGFRRAKEEKARIPKAAINGEACAGCKNCLLNCEQGAIEFEKGFWSGHCKVEKTRCKGCGSCLANCVSGCIEFT